MGDGVLNLNDEQNNPEVTVRSWIIRIRVAIATGVLKSVLGPTTEILSFAPPKESIQRKGGPDAAFILRSEAFDGDRQKGLPAPSSTSGIPAAPLSG